MNTHALLVAIESLTFIGVPGACLTAGGRRWVRVFMMVFCHAAFYAMLVIAVAPPLSTDAIQWLCFALPVVIAFLVATFLVVHRGLTLAPRPLTRVLRRQPMFVRLAGSGTHTMPRSTNDAQRRRRRTDTTDQASHTERSRPWSRARPVSPLMFGDPAKNPDRIDITGDSHSAARMRSNLAFAWLLKNCGVLDRLPTFWSLPVPVADHDHSTTISAAFAAGERDLLLTEVVPARWQHDNAMILMYVSGLGHAAAAMQQTVGPDYTVRAFLVVGEDPLDDRPVLDTFLSPGGEVRIGSTHQFVEMLAVICERMTNNGYFMNQQEAAASPLAAYFLQGQRAATASV